MREAKRRVGVSVCGGIGLALMLTGCGGDEEGHMGGFPVSAVVARAEEQVVEDSVVVVGTLESRNDITVVTELDATVQAMPFKEGEAVRRGDLLIQLDDVRTMAQLEEAEAGYRLAELSYNRNKELLENQTISQQEYDQAEATYYDRKAALALARDQQANAAIEAPFDGVVGERLVSAGQFVTRGDELTHLMSMNPLEISFEVPERHAGRLRHDLTVSFTADAYPHEDFEGRVTYVAPSVSQRTRAVRVKAEVANTDGRLKPGMFGELALILERREHAVVIPEASIKLMGDKAMVVVVSDEGLAQFRHVEVGLRSNSRSEIIDGLAPGELIVVEGHQKVFAPGMPVMAAPESAAYGVTPGSLGASAEGRDANL